MINVLELRHASPLGLFPSAIVDIDSTQKGAHFIHCSDGHDVDSDPCPNWLKVIYRLAVIGQLFRQCKYSDQHLTWLSHYIGPHPAANNTQQYRSRDTKVLPSCDSSFSTSVIRTGNRSCFVFGDWEYGNIDAENGIPNAEQREQFCR